MYNMMNKRNQTSDSPRKRNSPKELSYELIKLITNDFSEELGRGAFGQVFKGVLEDGEEVAVKMLRFMPGISDQQFENEFEILKRLKHPNIVQLVGFCDEAQEELAEYNGNLMVCHRIHRALCLEYMSKGSLGKLLSGEDTDRDLEDADTYLAWCHRVIMGICEGLRYLQEGLEFPIFHLDLKPDNILLDRFRTPKISDFGLSRIIGEENSKKTLTHLGTIGYIPPEFINDQVISKEYDIYSLGVIITKIITGGICGYPDVTMAAEEFVEHVHYNWKKGVQERPIYIEVPRLFEPDFEQVKRYIKIARTCMENDRHKRPTITDIVIQLTEIRGPRVYRRRIKPVRALLPRVATTSMHKDDPPSVIAKTKKDPPSEISHSAHPEHKLKLKTADSGAPFLCDGCKEPGYGPRYACDCGRGGHSLDLHTRCALAEDPLFNLHTLVHPLFGYGKQFELRFLHEAPSSSHMVQEEEGRTRVCDACGEDTRGFVYHCSEQGVNLHPCCASLPDRIVHDGRAFDIHRRASRACALCPEDEDRRRWFWAYRCNVDGETAVDLHVACLKETARRSWETCYRNRPDVGDGAQINVDGMLENSIGFDKFGEVAATVAGFITALVFGNLIVKL